MAKSCPLCGTIFPDSSTFCQHDGTGLRTVEEGDDLINHTFCDRYVAIERLGEGGMGTVYLARDVRLPQQVAVKVNRQPANADKTSAARFRQEAEAASRINHDRVARVFDFGFMDDGRPYIVMEYVEGKTLKDWLDDGPLDAHDAAVITVMIAEALNAAHRLGILHRDLKPENVIILDDTSGGLRLKVLDFGIAKVTGASDPDVRTKTGFVIGTPLWMSPEQLLGDDLDARSDVYALALLAFAMLTGHRAFASENRQAEVTAPMTSSPHTLQTARPTVTWPAPLQALFDRTLSRTVADRPASALEFAGEMARIVSAVPVPVPVAPITVQPDAPSPTPAVARRYRALYATLGALSLGLTAVAVAVFASTRDDGKSVTDRPVAGVTADSEPVTSTPSVPGGIAPTASVPGGRARDSLQNSIGTDSFTMPLAGVSSKPVVGSSKPPGAVSGKPATAANRMPVAPKAAGNRKASENSSSIAPLTLPFPDTTDETKLKQLMLESDTAEVGLLSQEFKVARARRQLRELASLKLAAPLNRGFAWFYRGQAHATLGESEEACSAFARAEQLATGSPVLRRNAEEFQRLLKCSM